MEWLFVDDTKGDRQSFAEALSLPDELRVTAISGAEARERLTANSLMADGILMDIDLSNETGQAENGLAITAAIRAAQNRGAIASFPVVRFSYRDRVAENIGHDPSSDDFFDLAIDKDGLSAAGATEEVQNHLLGMTEVYASISGDSDVLVLMGSDAEKWASFGHSGFTDDLMYANRPHLKAGIVVRALEKPGLLIEEQLLGARLGVDLEHSDGAQALLSALAPAAYDGVGSAYYRRWWARAVELWWTDSLGIEEPLAAYTIGERVGILCDTFPGLVPVTMPQGSPGDRPWRLCTLTLEKGGGFIPVDPEHGVPYRPRSPLPEWLDPTYAALGPAIKNGNDPRLDREELARQRARIKSQ
jgi:CheY-like chemotaxis protein